MPRPRSFRLSPRSTARLICVVRLGLGTRGGGAVRVVGRRAAVEHLDVAVERRRAALAEVEQAFVDAQLAVHLDRVVAELQRHVAAGDDLAVDAAQQLELPGLQLQPGHAATAPRLALPVSEQLAVAALQVEALDPRLVAGQPDRGLAVVAVDALERVADRQLGGHHLAGELGVAPAARQRELGAQLAAQAPARRQPGAPDVQVLDVRLDVAVQRRFGGRQRRGRGRLGRPVADRARPGACRRRRRRPTQFAPSALTLAAARVSPSACLAAVGSCTSSVTLRSPLVRASCAATCHWPSKAACSFVAICRSPCQPRSGWARAISCATENGASAASTAQCALAPGAAGAVQNEGCQFSARPANSAPPAATRSVCQWPAASRDRLRSNGFTCTQFGLTTVARRPPSRRGGRAGRRARRSPRGRRAGRTARDAPCQAGVLDGVGLPAPLQHGVEPRGVGVADVGQVREPGRRADRRLALQLQLVLRQRARERRLRVRDARDARSGRRPA